MDYRLNTKAKFARLSLFTFLAAVDGLMFLISELWEAFMRNRVSLCTCKLQAWPKDKLVNYWFL